MVDREAHPLVDTRPAASRCWWSPTVPERSSQAEEERAEQQIEQWRSRLTDISWLMRTVDETRAHGANAEDQCKGRFWD